jgi:hypothetical protein
MITTDKEIEIYGYECDNCGRKVEFASNAPSGELVSVICKCYEIVIYELPEREQSVKYQYKARKETRDIRYVIQLIFQSIRRTMTVRQVFYQAVSKGFVPKDEQKGYNVIQRNLLEMRRYGLIPYSFVADVSRRWMKPTTYNGLESALEHWMNYYRQDVWAKQSVNVEIWLEKEALSGIFQEITRKYDVPLFLARGFSSESFLYEAAEMIKESGKPTYVYFFSDYDPSGLALCAQVEKTLPRFGAEIIFRRSALNQSQIEKYNLPTRPTKKTTHSKGFEGNSVEIDALHPDTLHELIESCILNHISEKDLRNIKMEEAVHRETLVDLRNNLRQAR